MFKLKNLSVLSLMAILCINFSQCKKDDCKENIKTDCICPENYDPVCGCNNKTYGNACMAECSGITEYTKERCK